MLQAKHCRHVIVSQRYMRQSYQWDTSVAGCQSNCQTTPSLHRCSASAPSTASQHHKTNSFVTNQQHLIHYWYSLTTLWLNCVRNSTCNSHVRLPAEHCCTARRSNSASVTKSITWYSYILHYHHITSHEDRSRPQGPLYRKVEFP